MTTDDSMSDDVFESSDDLTLRAPGIPPQHPSPTGYRDYKPPAELFRSPEQTEQDITHKVRLKRLI